MLLKVAEINKKLLTFRKDRHFIDKCFHATKFCESAHKDGKFENKS